MAKALVNYCNDGFIMSFRRAMRHIGNTRIGLRTALVLILCFLALHTCFLLLVRNGYLVPALKGQREATNDKRRDVGRISEAPEKLANASVEEGSPHGERKVLPTAEPEVKRVDLHQIVRNLGQLQDTVKDYGNDNADGDGNVEEENETGNTATESNKQVEIVTQVKAHKVEKVRETFTQKSCIRYVSIYTPRMKPFHYWREYVNLEQAFQEATSVNSSHYDSRIVQRREFPTMFVECPGYRCDVALRPTADERFLARSDAILINVAPQEVRYKMPKISERLTSTLPRRAKIFFYAMECPLIMSYWDHTIKDIKYHYTMTYHSESDVYFPYGQYIPGEPTDTVDINYAENKTGLLVWTASNCHNTFWPRLEWVRSLEKLMSFDTYGKCGRLTCLPPMSPNCTRQQSVYKFYLALENAPCDEYISEKVWDNSLLSGLVPIVYGGKREAYERVLPPNSFIHVSDFSSQQELVDYLKMIDKNDNLYNEFFAWRRQGRVEKIYPNLYPKAFCKVLPKLSKYSKPPIKRIGDSQYFQGCRGGPHRNFTEDGDIDNWTPWR